MNYKQRHVLLSDFLSCTFIIYSFLNLGDDGITHLFSNQDVHIHRTPSYDMSYTLYAPAIQQESLCIAQATLDLISGHL